MKTISGGVGGGDLLGGGIYRRRRTDSQDVRE